MDKRKVRQILKKSLSLSRFDAVIFDSDAESVFLK